VADGDRRDHDHAVARIVPTKPGSATRSFPGIEAEILNEQGERVDVGGGYLAIMSPWPSMLRGIYGDPERYVKQYWSKWPGIYFTGDGAKRDEDGYFWLLGRVDDVMNVAGQPHRDDGSGGRRLVDHHSIAEAAVVASVTRSRGRPSRHSSSSSRVSSSTRGKTRRSSRRSWKEHVSAKIGAIARPEKILVTADLPKTRSGKIHAPPPARHRRGPGAGRRHERWPIRRSWPR